eukprot:TRINITY_DN195_c0_g1_i1.p1 TRINITY_DN195_c0_g1~~TRINITY_DN195_c0_g1_i1.p1  ORF type:complete len:155 (+),score=26.17 TRINITY_DN195_c0_g1_i1:179-643(+)
MIGLISLFLVLLFISTSFIFITILSFLSFQLSRTPLHFAAGYGHMSVVQLLIERGSDVNAKDHDENEQTPLHLAAQYGHLSIVQLLIDRGSNMNAKTINEETPLHQAANCGHLSVVELLIDKGSDVNAKDTKGVSRDKFLLLLHFFFLFPFVYD